MWLVAPAEDVAAVGVVVAAEAAVVAVAAVTTVVASEALSPQSVEPSSQSMDFVEAEI